MSLIAVLPVKTHYMGKNGLKTRPDPSPLPPLYVLDVVPTQWMVFSSSLQAIDFFGIERVLFGTDTPMDMGTRGMFTVTTIASLEALDATPADKEALYSG